MTEPFLRPQQDRLEFAAPDRDGIESSPTSDSSRAARKRQAILNAATSLFLQHGYRGTSMDQVAALAAVSKQTVYKHFSDKERLFRTIVLGITGTVDAFVSDLKRSLAEPSDLEAELRGLARRYLGAVMQPRVLQLRRLLVGEGGQFPELGRAYYERGPRLVISALAESLTALGKQGLLRLDDPTFAAEQLAYLILSVPLDRALICGEDAAPPAEDVDRIADGAIDVFLAAYGAGRRPVTVRPIMGGRSRSKRRQ